MGETERHSPGQGRCEWAGGRASGQQVGGPVMWASATAQAGKSRPADQQIRPVVAAAAGTTGPRGHAYTVRAGERAYVRARLEPRALSGSTIQGLDTSRAANKRNLVGFLEQKISLCAPAGKPHAPPHGRHPGECASECASKRTTCGVVAVVKGRINNRDASCGRCKPTMNPLRGRHARPWHVGCASRGGAAAHRSSQKQGRPGHNGQRARGRRARADRRQACKPACKRASRQAARQKVHDATDQEREEMLGARSSQRTPKQRASRTSRGGPSNERPNNGANVILDLGVPSVPAASRAPAKPTPALGRQGPRHAALLAQPQFWKTADPPTRTLQRPSRLAYPPGNRLEPISHLVSGWLAASAGPAVCPLFLSISVPRLGAAALHGTIACPATGRDMSSGTSLGASGCSAVGRPASNLSHLFRIDRLIGHIRRVDGRCHQIGPLGLQRTRAAWRDARVALARK
ncbi:hypothetical protein Purlil1_1579 [Purpureocillium lilacinum]|uniref:Uncharacterized protein n=1 Tax=Purpureocillium lilacinum TaxID=33203 RepID=A0ABR0CDX1_PURLI|nr:hypothetical protein Purlil1_1579 [Purpureocillium lilacinum]